VCVCVCVCEGGREGERERELLGHVCGCVCETLEWSKRRVMERETQTGVAVCVCVELECVVVVGAVLKCCGCGGCIEVRWCWLRIGSAWNLDAHRFFLMSV
jgi:hypothetical protein